MTEETDAVSVVVSEERGSISLCFGGNVARDLDATISDAAGDARNTTVPATSIGSPMRPSGMWFSTFSWKSGWSRLGRVPSVQMKVGAMLLTEMPYLAHSAARQRVRWLMAALLMQ